MVYISQTVEKTEQTNEETKQTNEELKHTIEETKQTNESLEWLPQGWSVESKTAEGGKKRKVQVKSLPKYLYYLCATFCNFFVFCHLMYDILSYSWQ